MTRRGKIAAGIGGALGGVLLLALIGILIVTQTRWGRGHVLRIALEQLDEATDGEVEIARLEGNLLRRARLIDVSIVDDQDRPFVVADTLETGFSLFGLFRQRIELRDVRLVNGVVVLDQPPGEDWNYARIFRIEPDPPPDPDPRPGWGDNVVLRDVVLANVRVTVRTEWEPEDGLSAAQRERAIEEALSGETRANVQRVPGGFQNVMDFRDLNASFPRARVAHPDRDQMVFEIGSLSGILQPFLPPEAVVRDLSGQVRISSDSLYFEDVDAVLPGSRITGFGAYDLSTAKYFLDLGGDPVTLADLRWLYPPLPQEGGGRLRLRLETREFTTAIDARDIDLRVGESGLAGQLAMVVGDTVRFGETDLTFDSFDTRVADRLIDDFDLPLDGWVTGRAALLGPTRAMRVDAALAFDDRLGGTSRVTAAGVVGMEEEIRFGDLYVRLEPLQVNLVRREAPGIPLPPGGTLAGELRLDGAPAEILRVDGHLTHQHPRTGTSRVVAEGGLDMRDELRLSDLRIRAEPLQAALLHPHVSQIPPTGTITGVARLDGMPGGALRLDGDVTLRDPAAGVSRVLAGGEIDMSGDAVRFTDLRLRLDPLQAALLRDDLPQLPPAGTVRGDLRLDGSTAALLQLTGDLTLQDPGTGESRVIAQGGIDMSDEFSFQAMRLRLEPLRLDLFRDELPDLPPGVVATGPIRLDGSPARRLDVDGDLVLRDPRSGISRITAIGGVRVEEPIRFHDLRVRVDPLRVEFIRPFVPDLPLGGTLVGTATLDGSPAARLAVSGDLVHLEAGERSHVVGQAVIVGEQRAEVDVRLLPLSLVTAGRFAPQAGLRGWAEGRLQASGDLDNLQLLADLRVPDDGRLVATGWLDVAADHPGYDIDLGLEGFNLAAVTRRAPAATSLTGSIDAAGRGIDPATMRADLAADLAGPRVDGVEADTVHLRAGVERGLASFRSSLVRLETAEAWLDGSFGLVEGVAGELEYRIQVDSLHPLAPYVTAGPTVPIAEVGAEVATAPADAEEPEGTEGADRAERVDRERIAADEPPAIVTDTVAVPELVQPELAGSLEAEGRIRGNLERFDLLGRLEVEDFVYQGNFVGRAAAEHEILALGTDRPGFAVQADAERIRAQGFEFESATLRVEHQGTRYGTGTASFAAVQNDDSDIRADLDFTLAVDRNELRLQQVDLRFDTVNWRSTQPGVVSWNGAGVQVANFELQSDTGARIFLDGQVPVDGIGDLQVVVEELPLDHVVSLLQQDADATGVLSLQASVAGTLANPTFDGETALLDATHDGREIPDTRATFAYSGAELTLDATFLDDGQQVGRAEGLIPIDLALADRDGPRLLDAPLAIELEAQGLPLEALPALTDAVSDIRGRIDGAVSVNGTFADPQLDGVLDLDLASFRVEASGVRYEEVTGTIRFQGRTIVVDSLVAWNGGPIRVTGEIDLATLEQPVLALELESREAMVVDNEYGRLWVDADLEIQGPFDGIEVAGPVRTHRGVFYLPEGAGPGVVDLDDPALLARLDPALVAERDALVQPSPLLANLQLAIELVIAPETWVRTNEANVEVYTDPEVGPLLLEFNGANGQLSIEGTLNTDRGEYEFMGRRFDITRGAATFLGRGEFDPLVQISAEHEVQLAAREPLEIRIVVQGTALDPSIALESNARPPLPQTDLLSMLAFGRPASSLLQQQGSSLTGQGAAAGDLVGNLAGIASQQLGAIAANALLQEFERDAARELGLDVLHITPADLPAELFTGRFEDLFRGTRIEAGAYVGRRVFAAASARPTTETRPGARIEYRLPEGYQIVTSWEPRYLSPVPTLVEVEPDRTSVFGTFFRREWRF